MVNNKTLKALEYDKILNILSAFAVAEISKHEILKLTPSFDFNEVSRLLRMTDEAYIAKTKYNFSSIPGFDDVSEILAKCKVGASLQPGELLSVARLLRCARILKTAIINCGDDMELFKESVASIFFHREIETAITDAIAGENEIKDDASEKLRSIRRKIKSTDIRLKEKLQSYTRAGEVSKYLQDNLITVRGGRFVLPVKSECRSSVPGLIHDQSASGATVFIEPFAIVELNNELKSLKSEEAHEIEKILAFLSTMVSDSSNNIEICQNSCIMLDIVFAKNEFSIFYNCITPKLNSKGKVNLTNARHPLIDKDKVVPIDIAFGDTCKFLLITGPNTGGKTVCLKTVGLFCLMAYSGIKLPCSEECELGVFDNIFCDIGDEQSILSSLSTFSSHIKNIISITEEMTNSSLVLFDELGGGTDPSEGAALAIGIIKFLEIMGARGVLTTHYDELKEYALVSDNVKNACMQFDEESLKPTYKVIMGIPGRSNAIKISRALGLNDFILREAEANLNPERVKFEKLMLKAEKAESDAICKRDEAEKLRAELAFEYAALKKERHNIDERLTKIKANAAQETKKIIQKQTEKAENIIEEMKELLKESDERALMEARRLKRELEDAKYITEKEDFNVSYRDIHKSEIQIGQKVYIKSLGTLGSITTLPNQKGELEVNSGNATIKLKISALGILRDAEPNIDKIKASNKSEAKSHNTVSVLQSDLSGTTSQKIEIKVIGLTVFEAIEVVYPYVISLKGTNSILKIIHGKGSGALGRGIQSFLKKELGVRNVRYGDYSDGGTGVTVAEIF